MGGGGGGRVSRLAVDKVSVMTAVPSKPTHITRNDNHNRKHRTITMVYKSKDKVLGLVGGW